MTTDRSSLPLRQNCEGYFLDEAGNILAQPTDKGYLLFPGGGIEAYEDPQTAIERETLEETGASVRALRYLGHINYEWPKDWAKTEKQKCRYEQFRGDEMHFFTGTIKAFTEAKDEEDSWQGEKLLPITRVIDLVEQMKPFPGELAPYYSAQLEFLKSLHA